MNRLAGLLFSHTRSIQVFKYKDKVVYEIPLMSNEVFSKAPPSIEHSYGSIQISYPVVEWIKSQSSQNASPSLTVSKEIQTLR